MCPDRGQEGLEAGSKASPALRRFCEQAQREAGAARQRYLLYMVSRPLGPVVALQERVCSLLQSMGPEDVTYQEGLGSAALVRFVAEQLGAKKVEKALQEMLWRVKKHHGEGTPMQEKLWGEMKALLLERYRKLEAALRQCHGDRVRLQPSSEELLRMLRSV